MADTRICTAESAPEGTLQLMKRLLDSGMPADCREIYRGRNIVAVSADGVNCIKAFRVNGFVKSLIYGSLRSPKAVRAFDNAIKLRELGFDTPEPFGVAVKLNGPLLGESYYVCRYVEGYSELRDVELCSDFARIARALAAFMTDLHGKGVLMKDFSPGNVLYRRAADGSYRFMLVDINRMEFGVTDKSRLYDNFKALLNTAAGVDAVARNYAELAGCADPDALVAKLNGIYAGHQAFLARKRRIKRRLRGK